MNRVLRIAVLILVVLAGISLLYFSSNRRPRWTALSRVSLNLKERPNQDPYDPTWIRNQYIAITNFFRQSITMEIIQSRAGIKCVEFELAELRPVRGTSLIEVRFRGVGSNAVFRSTAAATEVFMELYPTNHPEVKLEYIDTGGRSYPPYPIWRQALNWVRDLTPW